MIKKLGMLHSFTRPCLGFACVCELLLLIPHRGNAPTERLPLVSLENNPGSHCGRTSDSNLDYSMSFKNIVQKNVLADPLEREDHR